jgi:hypothetical protein
LVANLVEQRGVGIEPLRVSGICAPNLGLDRTGTTMPNARIA